MRRYLIGLTTIALTLLTACGADTGGNNAGNDAGLLGQWETGCYGEGAASSGPKNYKREGLTISQSSLVTKTWFYPANDSACENLQYATQTDSKFQLGSEVEAIPGARTIDIRPYKTQITPGSVETAGIFNQLPDSYCDLTDWTAGVARDVTNRSCVKESSVIYDIYQREGGRLVFGYAYGDDIGSRPDLRPKTLDQERIFQKV